MDLEELWVDLATELPIVLATYRSRMSELRVREKPDHTLLTEADLAIEAMIIDKVRGWDPEAKVIAEESGTGSWRPGVNAEPERIWVIDPIDGTAEFVRPSSTEFCSVVCLLEHGEPVTALIVAPELGTNRTPIVVFASKLNNAIEVNGMPSTYSTRLDPAVAASMTRSSKAAPAHHETALMDAGYTVKTRTTSQTLDMMRTALDINVLAEDSPRFDIFYRPNQKVWDGLAGLCLGEIVGLMSTDLDAGRLLPVSVEMLALPEPTFASTVMGRPEAVKWFLELAQDSRTKTPRSL